MNNRDREGEQAAKIVYYRGVAGEKIGVRVVRLEIVRVGAALGWRARLVDERTGGVVWESVLTRGRPVGAGRRAARECVRRGWALVP